MNIPKEIIICGHKIKIEKINCKDDSGLGNFHNWYSRIRIQVEDTTEDMQAEILLHEILEAIKSKFDLKIEHNELVVFSEVLFGIIRENKLDFRDKS